MRNGVGVAQNVVLFGGTSEIGIAVLESIIQPGMAKVSLVCRDVEAGEAVADRLSERHGDLTVEVVRFDASDTRAMGEVVSELVSDGGDIDVAIVAQGLLAQGADHYASSTVLEEVMAVNATASMALLHSLAGLMRNQGYGRIILLSSVAAVRPRRANPVYGASKAAVDSFALALDHDLEGSGVSILVVRPGFVTTKMTKGMKKAPLSTTPAGVASAVGPAVNSSKTIVYAPRTLGPLFAVLRMLPEVVWRRLPLG